MPKVDVVNEILSNAVLKARLSQSLSNMSSTAKRSAPGVLFRQLAYQKKMSRYVVSLHVEICWKCEEIAQAQEKLPKNIQISENLKFFG